jgi:hypothetical protein
MVTCGSVTLFGAGAGLAGGRAASSRRGGWPEPSGVELLGGLAIVADALASARPDGPAFAAMAIPTKNAVPRPRHLPIVDISYPVTFLPPRRCGKEKKHCAIHFPFITIIVNVAPTLDRDDSASLGFAVGSVLASVHSFDFEKFGFLGPDLRVPEAIDLGGGGLLAYLRHCILEGLVGSGLGRT